MPTTLEAFTVGYGLNMVGTFFDGAALLAGIGAAAPAELKELCQEQLQALTMQSAPTRWHIRQIDKAMTAAGLEAPKAPAHVDDYEDWVEAVSTSFYAKLDGEDPKIAAYLFGWYLGAWIQLANLGVIVLILKDAQADHAPIDERIASLKDDLGEAMANLAGTVDGAPLPEATAAAAKKATDVVRAAPPLDDPDQEVLDVADDYQEALHELTEVVEKIETTFS